MRSRLMETTSAIAASTCNDPQWDNVHEPGHLDDEAERALSPLSASTSEGGNMEFALVTTVCAVSVVTLLFFGADWLRSS